MGLLDLIGKKGLEISLKTVMKVRTFPTSLVARLVARMWMSLRLCTRRQSMPVCVFLLKRWRHHIYEWTENGKEKKLDHPLYFLLHDEPNPEMSSFIFRETIMSHLLIWGNAYVQIIRDKSGMVSLLLKQKASVLIRKLLLIIWQRMS